MNHQRWVLRLACFVVLSASLGLQLTGGFQAAAGQSAPRSAPQDHALHIKEFNPALLAGPQQAPPAAPAVSPESPAAAGAPAAGVDSLPYPAQPASDRQTSTVQAGPKANHEDLKYAYLPPRTPPSMAPGLSTAVVEPALPFESPDGPRVDQVNGYTQYGFPISGLSPNPLPPDRPFQTGAITGTVTDDHTGLPLQDVGVAAFDSTGMEQGYDTTTSTGVYTISSLAPAAYFIGFFPGTYPDKITQYYQDKLTLATADPVVVDADETRGGIDAAVHTYGGIHGTVTALSGGAPLEQISVAAYRDAVPWSGFATTDSFGEYTITFLAPGSYRLYFYPAGNAPAAIKEYLLAIYNQKPNEEEADLVPVSSGAITPGIDIGLQRGGRLTGIVSDVVSGDFLEGVNACLLSQNPPAWKCQTTGPTGVYTITGLLTDTVKVRFTPPPGSFYIESWYQDQYYDTLATPIDVAPDHTASAIDAALVTGGRLSGRVTSETNGDPLAEVRVHFYRMGSSLGFDAWTNASGYYSMTVPSGSYKLEFVTAESSFDLTRRHIPEFYKDKPDWGSADVIAISAGVDYPNYDASLVLGGSIAGQVTASDTLNGLGGVWVAAFSWNPGGGYWQYRAGTRSGPTGVYTVSGLTDGDFVLQFNPAWDADYAMQFYQEGYDFSQATSVTAALNIVHPGVDLALDPGVRITGTVTAAGSWTPLQDINVQVFDQDGFLRSECYPGDHCTDADGNYSTWALPSGQYHLYFSAPDWAPAATREYLPEYYHNRPFLPLADGVQVTLGSPSPQVDAALDLGGKIGGRVTSASTSAGLEGVQVLAQSRTGSAGGSAQTDANGDYTISGLQPGFYTVIFSPGSPSPDFTREHIGQNFPDPVKASVGGLTSGLDASLARGGCVSGTVQAADTHLPLPDVDVFTCNPFGPGGPACPGDRSDEAGAFAICALQPGAHVLFFSPDVNGRSGEYMDRYYHDQDSMATAIHAQVSPGATTSLLTQELQRGSAITGSVMARDTHNPVAGSVTLYGRYDAPAGEWMHWITLGSDNGQFRIPGLAPGIYGGKFTTDNLSPYASQGLPFPIAVNPGLTTTIELKLDPGWAITGTVRNALTHLPIPNAGVGFYTSDYGFGTATDGSGNYRMQGLPNIYGFKVGFNAPFSVGQFFDHQLDYDQGAYLIADSGSTVPHVDADLSIGGWIGGRVTASDGGRPLPAKVVAYDAGGQPVLTTYTDGGVYLFNLPPGDYRLKFTPQEASPSAYLDQFYHNKASLGAADVVAVTAGSYNFDLDVTLVKGGAITGLVQGVSSKNLDGVTVSVFDALGSLSGSGLTDASGQYTTTALAAGSYRLLFEPPESGPDSGYLPEYFDNRSTLAAATPVAVTLGAVHAGVNASLAPVYASLNAAARSLSEAAGTVSITVTLSTTSPYTITVPYRVGGSAARGLDHTLGDGQFILAPGSSRLVKSFALIDDSASETNETIQVTLYDPSRALLAAPAVQTITILDNDGVPPSAPPPVIASVAPTQGRDDLPNTLHILGEDFTPGSTASLAGGGGPVSLPSTWVSATDLRAEVPVGLPTGVYTLTVANPDGKQASLANAYRSVLPGQDDLFAYSYDLWTAPGTVYSDTQVSIGLVVRRQGGEIPYNNVAVNFYLGAPPPAGSLIAASSASALMPDNWAKTITATWTAPAAGTHTLYAQIDPGDLLGEAIRANNIISRTLVVHDLPVHAPGEPPDITPPVVTGLTASPAGCCATTALTLTVTAADPLPSSGLGFIQVVEYVYQEGSAQWIQVQAPGWQAYPIGGVYPWSLAPLPGAHYLHAWAADAAGNVSAEPAQVRLNYNPPTASLTAGGSHFFIYDLTSGENFAAAVAPAGGDPDLYVWPPDFHLRPPWSSIASHGVDLASFTAPVSGAYVVQVYGFSATAYSLAVSTGMMVVKMPAPDLVFPVSQAGTTEAASAKSPLGTPGLDPGLAPSPDRALAEVPVKPAGTKIYLPVLRR